MDESDHRWLSSTLGRWLTLDPLGFAEGDVDLYRFVSDNPVNHTDPSGFGYRVTNVDYTNKTVDITIDIIFKEGIIWWAKMDKWAEAIANAWSGKATCNCVEWTVTTTVVYTKQEKPKPDGNINVVYPKPADWKRPGSGSTASVSTPGPGLGRPGEEPFTNNYNQWGDWNLSIDGWSAAHEGGHFLGFADYYNRDPKSPNYGDPLPGYDGTIMATPGGTASKPGPDGKSFLDRLACEAIKRWEKEKDAESWADQGKYWFWWTP